MFSSTVEDENEEEECLSLDDLDMDYEQIMNYFDNLKVSKYQFFFKESVSQRLISTDKNIHCFNNANWGFII